MATPLSKSDAIRNGERLRGACGLSKPMGTEEMQTGGREEGMVLGSTHHTPSQDVSWCSGGSFCSGRGGYKNFDNGTTESNIKIILIKKTRKIFLFGV